MKYRLIEELRGSGDVTWKIQRQTRLLWIGPKVWKTFMYFPFDAYDLPGWSLFKCRGCVYRDKQRALGDLKDFVRKDNYNKVVASCYEET